MPTYEYECQECMLRFEKFQNMADSPLTTCPECGGSIKRLIGKGGAVIFKGSGFYVNDYRAPRTHCDRDKPCCGRDTACDTRPCHD